MHSSVWPNSALFHTLPPLPSLVPETRDEDPADMMLDAVRSIGGCYQLPGGHDQMRWLVPLVDGGVRRFPAPVGHQLVIAGHICRHPLDVPGLVRRLVRFIPRECMPEGFQFQISNEDRARYYGSFIRKASEEEIAARRRRVSAKRLRRYYGGSLA